MQPSISQPHFVKLKIITNERKRVKQLIEEKKLKAKLDEMKMLDHNETEEAVAAREEKKRI